MAHVFVLGSLNVDLQVSVAAFPHPGETVIGGELSTLPGGKGGNQAVAASRHGADVTMAGRIGDDEHGRLLLSSLRQAGVSTRLVEAHAGAPTGVALVLVGAAGENIIAVSPGANSRVGAWDAARALANAMPGDVLVVQLEIPLEAVRAAAEAAAARGVTVVLNAAPATFIDDDLVELVDVLVVNELEACALFGSVEAAMSTRAGVVVTLGKSGAIVSGTTVAAPAIEAVDTTGAGDAFVGSLAAELARGSTLIEAARVAVGAGARATLGFGAQSAPSCAERA